MSTFGPKPDITYAGILTYILFTEYFRLGGWHDIHIDVKNTKFGNRKVMKAKCVTIVTTPGKELFSWFSIFSTQHLNLK